MNRNKLKLVSLTFPHFYLFLFISINFILSGCRGDDDFTPRPRGYYRIDMPQKQYHAYDTTSCPFAFNYPVYATVIPDTERMAEPCWMDIYYPQFKATLYLSYKSVNNNISKLTEDYYTLANKHIPKASGMRDLEIRLPEHKVYGVYSEIKGPAASPTQFYLTDSAKHFIRCSLYFYAEPKPDSIAPVLEFINKDIDVMINTFRWK